MPVCILSPFIGRNTLISCALHCSKLHIMCIIIMNVQVFGRLPVCDVPLEHPSISRYHAVLQYRPTSAPTTEDQGEGGGPLSFGTPNEAGFYVYDLGSTHGSFLNKSKLQPRVYYKVRVGQMVKFGGSSRLFVLEVNN